MRKLGGRNNPVLGVGFTLIEVLLATFILALGVLGLAALFAGGARQQQLASETTRVNAFAEAAVAWEANFGVMSSLDEDGDGAADFDQVIDIGRWYGLATLVSNNEVNQGRVSLVARVAGDLLRYDPEGGGAGITRFQAHFRRANSTPVVLYQRPAHWAPRLNDLPGGLGAIAEASATAADGVYNPREPGSMFLIPPYSKFTPNPTVPEDERVGGPAFLPDRAILPETVELRVTYFEHAERYVFGQPETLSGFDVFTLPDGDGQLPAPNRAAGPRGRVIEDSRLSDFRFADPRSVLLGGSSPTVPLNQRVPENTLPAEVREPSGGAAGPNPPRFPDREVWDPDGESNLLYYGVFMPDGGRYPAGFDPDSLPLQSASAFRPSYLVMFLAPDLDEDDLESPNPTLVGFDLSGVLTDRQRVPSEGLPGGQEAGPLRSVEQIRVDRYVSRLERMPSPRDRVVTVPDETRDDGSRPVLGYASLYRRTAEGQGELAIFGYRINPTTRRGSFVPFEEPAEYQLNRNSPIVNSSFQVDWDPVRQQYFVVSQEILPDAVIRPGALILFAGPRGEPDSATTSQVALGADAAVRIVSRVRVGTQLRGYLDGPPRFRGRPLDNLGNTPPQSEILSGWHVRDRVRSAELIPGIPGDAQPFYQLESLEVRIVPMRER